MAITLPNFNAGDVLHAEELNTICSAITELSAETENRLFDIEENQLPHLNDDVIDLNNAIDNLSANTTNSINSVSDDLEHFEDSIGNRVDELSGVCVNKFNYIDGAFTYNATKNSFAEAGMSTATGQFSHAEGFATSATGEFSHSEGILTNASYTTVTAGTTTINVGCSHTEGNRTIAKAYAHAEGNSTKANGKSSHAEGQDSIADGETSHAEGSGTTAIGIASHSEGLATSAIGEDSHAEGTFTVASGQSSFAGGDKSTAINSYSHAEGQECIASGSCSQAFGHSTIAHNSNEFVCGYFNEDDGGTTGASGYKKLFVVGAGNNSTGSITRKDGFYVAQPSDYSKSVYAVLNGDKTVATTDNSDERLKENIVDINIDKAYGLIESARTVNFNFIKDEEKKLEIGSIAQDIEVFFPEMIGTNPVTGYKTLDYNKLTVPLMQVARDMNHRLTELESTVADNEKTIKSQQKAITLLNSTIADLTSRIEALEAKDTEVSGTTEE